MCYSFGILKQEGVQEGGGIPNLSPIFLRKPNIFLPHVYFLDSRPPCPLGVFFAKGVSK